MTAGAARQEYSAGGVVIHRQAGESRCLVIRDGHRNWGFPKGHIEPGETAERAAIREVVEETGIREPVIRTRLDTLEWDFMNSGERVHKTCYFYLMEAPDAATQPQHDEGISACRWVTFDEAERLVTHDNARGVLRRARDVIARDPAAVARLSSGAA